MPLVPMELAWLAGLLEGEGYFYTRKQNGPQSILYSFGITISITDQDVAEKASRIMKGKLYGPYAYRGNKPIYRANLERRAEVIDLIRELRPWMSKRRQEAIDDMFEKHMEHPPVTRKKG